MLKKTTDDYKKLAANFYKKYGLVDGLITPQQISETLKNNADKYRPAYFRRLRNALAFDQDGCMGAEEINKVKNPLTEADETDVIRQKTKPKQKRVKAVLDADYEKLLRAARDKKDEGLDGALVLSNLLGVRPAELFDIEIKDDEGNKVFIKGASKRSDRGLDRVIKLSDDNFKIVVKALKNIEIFKLQHGFPSSLKKVKSTPQHILQTRLSTLVKAIWPRRKHQITFYSFRHQLGSNLKASGIERIEMAYLLGHKSTKSIESCGNKRSSTGGIKITAGIEVEKIKGLVRLNHSNALSLQTIVEPD